MELLPQGRTGETVISQDTVKGQEVAKCPLDLPEYQTTQPQPQPQPLPPPNVITQQPLFNGTAEEHTAELPGASVRSDRADDEDSDDSMTDLSTTDDASHLLPNRVPTNPYQLQKVEPPTRVPLSSSPKTSPKTLTNGASPSPVCTPRPPLLTREDGALLSLLSPLPPLTREDGALLSPLSPLPVTGTMDTLIKNNTYHPPPRARTH
ncbi:unnamed protein product [Coregonus sp. 'balchen']|nr:unnamed protein product [Coregonus sp. 'balchen']